MHDNPRQYLIKWNNRFPFDRLYRKKYGIGFGSAEHRALNPVDMYFDSLEDKIVEESQEYWKEHDERLKLYSEGKWLRDREVTKEDEDVLYAKIDLSAINKLNK